MMMMNFRYGSLISFIIGLIIFVLIVKLIVGIAIMLRGKHKEGPQIKLKKNLKDYREAGLSDGDIKVFRETMEEAKSQVLTWEAATRKLDDMSVIEDVTGGLESAKKTFQYIVKHPQELTKQGDFLYKNLPNMNKLIANVENLQEEPVKNERDIDETLLLIRTLSEKVAENYHKLLMQEIKIIGKEMETNG